MNLAFLVLLAAVNVEQFPRMTQGRYEVLAQRDRNTAWQVNWFMNRVAGHYAQQFSNATAKAVARVIVFSNADDFRAYAKQQRGEAQQRLAGYTAVRKGPGGGRQWELVTFEYPGMWRTLAHEGLHQFLGYEFGANYASVPVWLNEGLAQYFETSYVVNQRLVVGSISKERLEAAQKAIRAKTAPTPTGLMQMKPAEFYRDTDVTYPVSWALVYYLHHGDYAAMPSDVFRAYLEDVKLGLGDVATFQRHFGRDTPEWRERFEKFVLKLKSQVN